ncbi:MAG: PAS domain S-box protein [Ferruginibacter sp.]|nr:PAS domain S-box protein [Chitinophagaceae bacterium]
MKCLLNVLLLEDSSSDAEIIQRLLLKERGDCEFRLATNKKTFLLALEEFPADVILSDNSLPGFNATAALKITRQHYLNVPFILITGTVSEEYAANIIKQGADDYILKDRMARLPAAIDAALKQRRNEKEKQEATEKLIESEAKYRNIFFKSPLPKWIYDAETFRFLDVNEAAILHYGYTAKEFLSMTIKDIRPEEDLEEFLNDIAKVKKGTATRQDNRRHLKKNGELIIVETKAHSIEYNNRKAIMVVVNDITERKRAEADLIGSEEKYRTLVEQAADGIFIADMHGRFITVNPRACSMSQYAEKELKQMTFFDLTIAEDIQRNPFHFEEMQHGKTVTTERLMKRKDGTIVDVETTGKILNDGRMLVFVRDITERKKAAEALRSNELRFRTLTSNAPVGIFQTDSSGKTLYVNEAWLTFTGLTFNEAMGDGWQKVLHPEDKENQLKLWQDRSKKGLESSTQFRLLDKKGNIRWVTGKATPLFNTNLQITGYIGTLSDITESKKAEEVIRLSEMTLKEAQAIAHISNWEIDMVQNIHTWSDEFYRIYGLNKGEIQPSAELFLSFMHPDDADFAQKKVAESFISFGNSSFSFRFIRKDGEVRHGYAEWKFEFDKKGNPLRLFGILQDITERKEAEEGLKKLETDLLEQQKKEQVKITATALEAQEKERHAIGIELHDNVNQILVGTSLMLSLGKSDPKKAQEMIGIAMNNLQEAIRENRKIAHVFVAPDLETETLLNQLKKLIQNMLETSGLQTDITITKFREDLLDRGRKINIYRIAQEQCTNIVKYAHATRVNITLGTAGGFFKMTIADNGIGMDSSKKTTGIGLKNINGRLSIFNGTANIITAPGKGFTLEITIPLEG